MADGRNGDDIIIDPTAGHPVGPSGGTNDTTESGVSALPDGTIVIEPASIGTGSDGGSGSTGGDSPRRKRGRPRGSRNTGTKEKGPTLDIAGIELILFNAHQMLAAMSRTPELELEQEEAAKISQGIANVGRHYDMQLPAKAVDWTNLLMIVGAVYGPRIAAIRIRTMRERSERVRPANSGATERKVHPEEPTFLRTKKPDAPRTGPTRTVNIPGVGTVEVPFDA